jgi:hypothetical protein
VRRLLAIAAAASFVSSGTTIFPEGLLDAATGVAWGAAAVTAILLGWKYPRRIWAGVAVPVLYAAIAFGATAVENATGYADLGDANGWKPESTVLIVAPFLLAWWLVAAAVGTMWRRARGRGTVGRPA